MENYIENSSLCYHSLQIVYINQYISYFRFRFISLIELVFIKQIVTRCNEKTEVIWTLIFQEIVCSKDYSYHLNGIFKVLKMKE